MCFNVFFFAAILALLLWFVYAKIVVSLMERHRLASQGVAFLDGPIVSDIKSLIKIAEEMPYESTLNQIAQFVKAQ